MAQKVAQKVAQIVALSAALFCSAFYTSHKGNAGLPCLGILANLCINRHERSGGKQRQPDQKTGTLTQL